MENVDHYEIHNGKGKALTHANTWQNPNKKTKSFDTLKEAISLAKKITFSNEVILFSPACSSFDAFSNFQERGNAFKQIVLNE